tara:strand:- start:887 stop:1384 length:498 start_codon:yes stop_codon:yes gene_type:complete
MAYLGGLLALPKILFQIILLITLIFVIVRIYVLHHLRFSIQISGIPKWLFIFGLGGIMGFIAGTVGIGGGIYLVPLIIMFGLGSEKEAAAAGAMFIWVNSLAGVIARSQSGMFDAGFILPLAGAVIVGGFGGSYLGAVRFDAKTIQKVMGAIVIIAIIFLLRDIL